jgi:glycosyltransferase 2 family protein
MRWLTLILLAVATVFLFWMLDEIGWSNIGRQFLQIGYYWPLVLVPYGLLNILVTLSWSSLLLTAEVRPSLGRLFLLRLAGESLNQLTPTASIGGEPYKAMRLTAAGVPWEEATASVVIQRGILVLGLVTYILLGLALAPFLLRGASSNLEMLGLGALLLGCGGVAFVVLQSRGPCIMGVRLLERLRLCPARLKAKEPELVKLDAFLADFYREHPRRGLLAFMLVFASWVSQAIEVYLVFWLLGHPISWGLALCLDALIMLFAAAGFMIPASIGVQDGGSVLLSLGFNLGATLGAAVGILRRIREAFWLSLGLLVLAREK